MMDLVLALKDIALAVEKFRACKVTTFFMGTCGKSMRIEAVNGERVAFFVEPGSVVCMNSKEFDEFLTKMNDMFSALCSYGIDDV